MQKILLISFLFLIGAGYELVINGDFEAWYFSKDHISDAWRKVDTLTVSVESTLGYTGYGVKVRALTPGNLSGIRTNFATAPGEQYEIRLKHKGGEARLAILPARRGNFEVLLNLNYDRNWTDYLLNWQATSEAVSLYLLDNYDTATAHFDDISCKEIISGNQTYEPPINIIFVIHVEGSAGPRYQIWMLENTWLKQICRNKGFKLTYLTHGAYMEDIIVNRDQDSILDFINQGHQVGTHNHGVIRIGPQTWRSANQRNWDTAYLSWYQNRLWVDSLIGANNNQAMCAGVHLPFEQNLMDTFNLPMGISSGAGIPGEISREAYGFDAIGHHPHHPWRPSASIVNGEQFLEDLQGRFVNFEHYAQVGSEFGHGFPNRVEDIKRFFRYIYKQWLSKESTPEPEGRDKVWVFGFLTHLGNNPPETRLKIDSIMTWLNDSFVGRYTPRGNLIARTATVAEVYNEYLIWEANHPGLSSFSFKMPELSTPLSEMRSGKMENLDVFPNPTKKVVRLQAKGRVKVYDLFGRLIKILTNKESPIVLDLRDLKAGVYILDWTQEGKIKRWKIILLK